MNGFELLDAVVAEIEDVEIPVRIKSYIRRALQRPLSGALPAEGRDEPALF